SSTPPEADTVQKRGAPLGAQVAREDENITDLPSGVHPCTRSLPGCQVSLLGSPPSDGTTYTSLFPAYSPLKAIHFPSGEKCGLAVCPWKLVIRRAAPPARSTIHILFAYAKAIWVALTLGDRNSRVPVPLAATLFSLNNAMVVRIKVTNTRTKRYRKARWIFVDIVRLPDELEIDGMRKYVSRKPVWSKW